LKKYIDRPVGQNYNAFHDRPPMGYSRVAGHFRARDRSRWHGQRQRFAEQYGPRPAADLNDQQNNQQK
jgi:hypothetical protein